MSGASEGALAVSIAMAMTVVISPVVWVNHYVVAAPALLIVPLWLREHGKDPTARALMAPAVGTVVVHYAVRSFDRNIMILGPGFTAWLIVAVVAVAISPARRPLPEESAPARGSDC